MYVYAIYNKENNKLYIGQTNDVIRRLKEHNNSKQNKGHFTSKFSGQWESIYQEKIQDRSTAIAREKQLKSSRGRAFLKTYINE